MAAFVVRNFKSRSSVLSKQMWSLLQRGATERSLKTTFRYRVRCTQKILMYHLQQTFFTKVVFEKTYCFSTQSLKLIIFKYRYLFVYVDIIKFDNITFMCFLSQKKKAHSNLLIIKIVHTNISIMFFMGTILESKIWTLSLPYGI